jgi:TRAP-type C4-dicarboxylate transport system permease small subunit
MKSPSRLDRILSATLLVIATVPLIIMMVIVTANSLGRAFFRTPVTGAIEIAGLAGAVLVSASVGFTARERGNVAVDILVTRLKPRVRAAFDAVTFLLSLGGVCLLLYAVILNAFKSIRLQDVTMTLDLPIPPFKFAWAAGIFILACYLALHLTTSIRKWRAK